MKKSRSHSLVLWFAKPLGLRCLKFLLENVLPRYEKLKISRLYLSERDVSLGKFLGLAEKYHVPFSIVPDLDRTAHKKIHSKLVEKKDTADLGVIIGFPHKLPTKSISQCKHGVINLHFAPLPKYRGSGTLSQAIIRQEKEYGVTFHYVDEKLDTGPIIAISSIPLDLSRPAFELLTEFEELAYLFFQEYIDSFLTEKAPATAQEKIIAEQKITPIFCTRASLEKLYKLDLTWTPMQILQYLRALALGNDKYPYIEIEGQKIFLVLET